MDFIAKNYEKMVLGFCLLLLIGSILLVSGFISRDRENLKKVIATDQQLVKSGGKDIETYTKDQFDAEKNLSDRRRFFAVLAPSRDKRAGIDDPKGSLLEPSRYIHCINGECTYLLSLYESKCPFCGEEQPALGKDAAEGEDSDGDGIPDDVEMKYAFLDPQNPMDAKMDYDMDGFSNLEEYRAKTPMDNPAEFPALGILLRTRRVFQQNLPIGLRMVDTNNKTEKEKWDIMMFVMDPKTGKPRNSVQALNNVFQGYRIVDVGFEGDGEAALGYVDVVSEGEDGTRYHLLQGKNEKSQDVTVSFVYLASRNLAQARQVVARFTKTVKVGEVFELQKQKGTTIVRESYKVLRAEADNSDSVVIGRVAGEDGTAVSEIEVPLFNPADDFINYMQMNNGADGGMIGPRGAVRGGGRRNNGAMPF